MCKKYGVVLLVCVLLPGLSYAQRKLPIPARLRAADPQLEWRVSRVLNKRVRSTYRQAHGLAEKYPSVSWSMASKELSGLLQVTPQKLYPNVPFLTTNEQLAKYFVARNNREIMSHLPRLQQQQAEIMQRLEDFKKSRQLITHSPKEDAPWLASQIPAGTSLLLLGERHNVSSIPVHISAVIKEVQRQNPHREIVLFSEFMPEEPFHGKTLFSKQHILIWDTANELGIPTIGLEPQFVIENASLRIFDRRDPSYTPSIWASLEGVRLRNTRWLARLKAYRQKYPQALFIVYAGNNHLLYGMPYSVADNLAGETPFVVTCYPQYIMDGNDKVYAVSLFDWETEGEFAQERVVRFSDPDLTRLAGFDIQLKLPPNALP